MKKHICWFATSLMLLALKSSGSDLSVDSMSYSFSGGFYYKASESYSLKHGSGLGAGNYRYGYLQGKITNHSGNRSGSVVGNLWVSDYVGAAHGGVTFSRNWGGNPSYVFNAYQSWTCTKYGYRKQLNRYGYGSLGVHEYNGGWPMRDELYGNTWQKF